MLAVQVQYLNYLEDKRHNEVVESQGKESLNIQRFSADTQRMAANEQARHNQQSELLGFQTLEETSRHNLAYESETYRHNVATEDETRRHNLQSEYIGRQQVAAAQLQAQSSAQQAQAAMQNAAANASRAALEQTKWEKEGKYLATTNVQIANLKREQEQVKTDFSFMNELIQAISPFN